MLRLGAALNVAHDLRGSTLPFAFVGWSCCVLSPGGDVQLEQLSADGEDWFGEGPGGTEMGAVETVVRGCAAAGTDPACAGTDPAWIEAVAAAIGREVKNGTRRSVLLVKRASGWMFHASRSPNRDSIARHGLDWRRMDRPGIAGSVEPEWPGVFLCASLESARWFAGMPGPAQPTSGACRSTACGWRETRAPAAAGTTIG
jgi:hypothetical protein